MKMGVVADDITGAADIGIMFAKGGYSAEVHVYPGPGALDPLPTAPDICILDTNSRLDPPALAYTKVRDAALDLQRAGCRQFFNKTCSVFRGNIGPAFDAMLDALSLDFAVVVLGFPKNGRLTLDGVHYVRGVPLADSEFRHDPSHPMTRSNLVEILQSQTGRRVDLLDRTVVARGPAALRLAIEQKRAVCNYLILDVDGQPALGAIARAVHDLPVLCGSSALAEELTATWSPPPTPSSPPELPPPDGLGVLCAAGSLMPQTQAQIQYLAGQGVLMLELDPALLLQPGDAETIVASLVDRLAGDLLTGKHAAVHSSYLPARVAAARDAAARLGLPPHALGLRISRALGEIAARCRARTGLSRFVVAGGETSAAVCAALGVRGLRIWREIETGLPSCVSLAPPPLLLVLKSGSFGRPAFLRTALDTLAEQVPHGFLTG